MKNNLLCIVRSRHYLRQYKTTVSVMNGLSFSAIWIGHVSNIRSRSRSCRDIFTRSWSRPKFVGLRIPGWLCFNTIFVSFGVMLSNGSRASQAGVVRCLPGVLTSDLVWRGFLAGLGGRCRTDFLLAVAVLGRSHHARLVQQVSQQPLQVSPLHGTVRSRSKIGCYLCSNESGHLW